MVTPAHTSIDVKKIPDNKIHTIRYMLLNFITSWQVCDAEIYRK